MLLLSLTCLPFFRSSNIYIYSHLEAPGMCVSIFFFFFDLPPISFFPLPSLALPPPSLAAAAAPTAVLCLFPLPRLCPSHTSYSSPCISFPLPLFPLLFLFQFQSSHLSFSSLFFSSFTDTNSDIKAPVIFTPTPYLFTQGV